MKFIFFSVEPADYFSLTYFVLLLLIPLVLLALRVLTAKNKRNYHTASTLIKLIMLTGIGYSGMVFYLVIFKY